MTERKKLTWDAKDEATFVLRALTDTLSIAQEMLLSLERLFGAETSPDADEEA